jgi:hypothetical protein
MPKIVYRYIYIYTFTIYIIIKFMEINCFGTFLSDTKKRFQNVKVHH